MPGRCRLSLQMTQDKSVYKEKVKNLVVFTQRSNSELQQGQIIDYGHHEA